MKWETVTEWERKNDKEYPYWASVWSYDAYGECWEGVLWRERVSFYKEERERSKGRAAWDFRYEPMVCLPSDTHPKWGDGTMLVRNPV